MKTLFLNAPYEGEVELITATIDYLKEIKVVGLFASVQFCEKLERVKEQLTELGIKIITSQPKRASLPSQLLGCDCFKSSLNLNNVEIDAFLYIGDGRFHPLALAYAQRENKNWKPIICNDPVAKTMSVITKEDIERNLKRQKGALIRFLSAETIGVIITVKPGQEQFKVSRLLEEKYPNKKFYYFVDDNISFDQLENFPFIEVWINTACPRLGCDEQEKFNRGVINLNDAMRAEEINT